jgi:hypothetical protein
MVKVVFETYLVFNLNECIKLVAFCKTISPKTKKYDSASCKKYRINCWIPSLVQKLACYFLMVVLGIYLFSIVMGG